MFIRGMLCSHDVGRISKATVMLNQSDSSLSLVSSDPSCSGQWYSVVMMTSWRAIPLGRAGARYWIRKKLIKHKQVAYHMNVRICRGCQKDEKQIH